MKPAPEIAPERAVTFAAASCVSAGVGRVFRSGVASVGQLVAANRVVDFAAVNGHFLGASTPKRTLSPLDSTDHDRNVIVDDNTFVLLTR